jgi:hypothetical protein
MRFKLVILSLVVVALVGCAAGNVSEGSAMDRQKEIEEGNKKLGVEGTQE